MKLSLGAKQDGARKLMRKCVICPRLPCKAICQLCCATPTYNPQQGCHEPNNDRQVSPPTLPRLNYLTCVQYICLLIPSNPSVYLQMGCGGIALAKRSGSGSTHSLPTQYETSVPFVLRRVSRRALVPKLRMVGCPQQSLQHRNSDGR